MAEARKPVMRVDLQPELWVGDTAAAIAYYELAFGAVVEHRVGGLDDANGVAQLSVSGARFWVAGASEQLGRFDARSIGGGTARFLLVVGDPQSVVNCAVDASGKLTSAVSEEHGWLLGRIEDPFGHEWEVGRPLGPWPPAE
jgi:PhnB protein